MNNLHNTRLHNICLVKGKVVRVFKPRSCSQRIFHICVHFPQSIHGYVNIGIQNVHRFQHNKQSKMAVKLNKYRRISGNVEPSNEPILFNQASYKDSSLPVHLDCETFVGGLRNTARLEMANDSYK